MYRVVGHESHRGTEYNPSIKLTQIIIYIHATNNFVGVIPGTTTIKLHAIIRYSSDIGPCPR